MGKTRTNLQTRRVELQRRIRMYSEKVESIRERIPIADELNKTRMKLGIRKTQQQIWQMERELDEVECAIEEAHPYK
tara:strand:- start:1613 stop:1843 length:231 start_codon:yes stop_codon:yes gene_type:complete